MRNLAVPKTNNHRDSHLHALPGGGNARQKPVDRLGVGKVDRDFIHHLILTNGARYIRHRYVWGEELADQMIPVEGLHASVANTTSHRWDRIEMRIVAHCRHRGLQIASEFRFDVALKQMRP